MDNFQLISLFQQNATSTSNNTGYKYKLETGANIEIDIPLSGFTNFIDSLLSHIYSTSSKYVRDRSAASEANVDFNASSYSAVVCEKIDKMMIPIIVDINFEFNNSDDKRFYHDKFIYKCLQHLQGIILSIFKVPVSEGEFNKVLTCFVLESDPVLKGEKTLTKVRFHFPYAKVNIEHLNKVFIRRFRDVVIEENLIRSYVMQTPTNNLDRIIPDIGEYVSVVGFKQTNDESPLLLRGVYSYVEDSDNLDDDYINEQLLPFYVFYEMMKEQINFFEANEKNPAFMIDPNYSRYKAAVSIEPLDNALVRSKYIDIDFLDRYQRMYNLPLILSVHFCQDILQIDTTYQISPDIEISRPEPKYNEGSALNTRVDKYQMLSALLPMIGKHRFTEYYKHDWKAIGKSIHTIYNGQLQGLQIWKELTVDIEMKYECDFFYDNFSKESLDIRTIRHYANVDNNNAYNAWNRSIYFSKIEKALSLQEIDFIEFAIQILCIKFVYDRNDNTWYYFDGNRLRRDPGCCVLIDHLRPVSDTVGNDMIMKAIYDYQDEYNALSRNDKTRYGKSNYDGTKKQIDALIRSMSGVRFLKKIVTALEIYMYDDNLYTKIDINPDLMACENCILECIDKRIITREGKMQDYVTKSTNIYFPHGFTLDTPKVKYMFKYYGQVHTDHELCHFFLKMKGSLMRGGNAEKYFWNFIGKSNGSKSQVIKFMQASLGDYCVIVKNGSFTLNINANNGGPDPELERGRNAHAWILAETDRSEKWHAGHIKKHTSGDDYNNRTLNKEGGLRKALHQLIAMSNIDLDCPGADEAYYARYIKIPFYSKFVDNAPADEIEQYRQRRFPIDLDFSNKISVYAQADLYISFYYYSIYMNEGIRSHPELVRNSIRKYQKDMDVIHNFIHAKCFVFWLGDPKEKNTDPSHKVALYDLHRSYKAWFLGCYGRESQPLDQFKFRDEIADRICEVDDNGYFTGLELKPEHKMIQNNTI